MLLEDFCKKIDTVPMSVIEDIKAEIKSHDDQKHYPYGVIGIRTVLQIIDKHMGKGEQE